MIRIKSCGRLLFSFINFISSTYLVSFGFEEVYISTCTTVSAIVTILAKPVWARLADTGKCRLEAIIMVGLMAAGFIIFFSFRTEKVAALLYAALVTVSCMVLMDLVDSWVIKLCKEYDALDYGKVRSFGSIAYAITGLLFGLATTRFGLDIAPYVFAVILLGIGIVSQTVPDPVKENQTKKTFKESLSLLTDKRFLIFTIACSLSQATFNFTDAYIPVLILNRGGNTTHIGINDFIMSFIEFLMLKQFTKIADKAGTDRIVTFGMIGFCIKATLAALAPTPVLTMVACLSQAISFCMLVPARMRFIGEEVEKEDVSMAISITGVAGSLANICVSNPISQKLIPTIGLPKTMIIFGGIALLAAVVYYFGNVRRTAKEK